MGTRRALAAAVASMLFGLLAFGAGAASADMDDIPTSTVTGPVAVTAGSHPFLATDIDLSKYGYVEEEFFLEGEGYRYDTSGGPDVTGTRITTGGANDDGLYPFKTRIVVRRPADPANANGIVVAEWNNVTSTQDVEFNWFGDPYYLLKHGYTFVGVTAQNVGVNSLKAFDNARYGSLTVNGNGTVPTGEGLDPDALSYDVFSSVVKALKGGRNGVDPLGGIAADKVIASGESQSCGRLSTHYNKVEPLHGAVDAYLLTVCTSVLRTDRPEKAIRIITETENRRPRTTTDFPDTGSIRHWEVAGASHLPRIAFDNLNGVFSRDFAVVTASCVKFPLSMVKWPFTQNAAIRDLAAWSDGGEAPPIAPRGEYQDPVPASPADALVRDEYGIARGGIRYPDVTVPTAVNDGTNSPAPGGSLFSAFCPLFGSSEPFSPELLHSLYTDHADYLARHSAATDELVGTGFVLAEDGERLKQDAREYARLRPSTPRVIGKSPNKGSFQLAWVGTEAPDTTFQVQRASTKGGAWKQVGVKSVADGTATLANQPQGTARYRVRSTTILPATNISDPETVVTPFSEPSVKVKIDRTGPKKPRIVVKGRKAKGAYRGAVRVKVIGRPDRKLPDGTPGVGLNRKSVPKARVIRKKGRTVIKVRTRDKLGNKSPVARMVIRIR
jgi:hypothetical protein